MSVYAVGGFEVGLLVIMGIFTGILLWEIFVDGRKF